MYYSLIIQLSNVILRKERAYKLTLVENLEVIYPLTDSYEFYRYAELINDSDNNVRKDSFDINVIDINSIRFDERELSANARTKKTNLSENEKGYVDTINAAKNVDISLSTLSIPSKIAASKAAPNLFDKALIPWLNLNHSWFWNTYVCHTLNW